MIRPLYFEALSALGRRLEESDSIDADAWAIRDLLAWTPLNMEEAEREAKLARGGQTGDHRGQGTARVACDCAMITDREPGRVPLGRPRATWLGVKQCARRVVSQFALRNPANEDRRKRTGTMSSSIRSRNR